MLTSQPIDITLLAHAHRLLEKLIRRQGIRWFLDPQGPRLMALDKSKVELVVRMAIKARERDGGVRPGEESVQRCRHLMRREMIARVAHEMVATGC